MSTVKEAIEKEARELYSDFGLLDRNGVIVPTDADYVALCMNALGRIARLAATATAALAFDTVGEEGEITCWCEGCKQVFVRPVVAEVLGEGGAT